ncbi:hypothetical protein BELL_0534g00060 [Botrytis elliptica]|uniref:Uncharacterized protein n=1 Tax=Botrytis elliptica TaxID=278938 RepID=A0A4Z1JDW2_9HELO|nr:hypothetical protein EAE99_007840 [Botrytis elliptica]TGO71758.1 hypothetical protein BELL_0534g00060 [Botrytis elliptica]
MAPQTTDWVVEMAKGRMATTKDEYEEMHNQMSRMGLKGAYNPANVYPGSRFTPSSKPTPEEVREKARLSSQKILSDWNTLRTIVQLHADTLEKRWMKKSRKKQREMLLEAWPNMSTTHRPDYEAFRQECTGRILIGLSKFQEAYKWPYINLQDLSRESLVIFITSRGHNPPSAFARADLNATHLGTVAHFIPEPAFLPFHTLFLDGDKVETYGRLVSWDEDDAAADLMFTERQFSPGDGLKAFELQEKIYPFLIRCCELILHDFTKSGALLDANIPTGIAPDPVVAPEPTTAAVTEILPSLATISAEAPYRLPANIDFERLREIFAARLSAAEDYLFDLREDPGFFADTINDWSEHRNDALLDTNGNPHPTGPHTQDFWGRVVRNIISDAYSSYETWFLLHRQAALLCTLMEKYKDEISYNKQLPKEYLIAILKLRELLKTSAEAPIDYLQNIQSSPPLRHHFTRAPQAPGTTNMYIMPKDERSPFFHKPWGLLLILWDREKRDLFGLTNVIDAFEQLMQDPEESKNISSYIADRFSDLAILSRALYEVENYQPWAATFDDEYNNNHQREVLRITMTGFVFNNDYIEYMNSVLKGIVPYCMPGDGKFKYPVNKKRTKQSTEQMILAEKNLDFFWGKFDANWKKLTRKNIDACFGGHPPRKRGKIQRTSSWVEPLPIEATTKSQQASSTQEWAHDEEKNKVKTKSKKAKSKTRGSTQPLTQPEAQSENPEPQFNVEQSKVKIPRHLMRVFNTLFFQPGQNNTPGDVPWVEFLKAMVEMGFAAQKLYGSVWQFTPVSKEAAAKTGAEKSIQFHEPHPGVKINFVVARRMGRRLMRRFGWWGGMFEEE